MGLMQQQIMLNKNHSEKTVQDHVMVGRGAKNPSLPTPMQEINAMDLMGLSWILTDQIFLNETLTGGRK